MIGAPSIEFWITLALLVPATWFAVYKAGKHTVYLEVPVPMEGVDTEEGQGEPVDYAQGELPLAERKHPELIRRLREAARKLAKERGEITTDDIWEVCPIPDGIEGRHMGAAFYPRADWECTGYVKSRRSDRNHGRRIAKWRLRNAA